MKKHIAIVIAVFAAIFVISGCSLVVDALAGGLALSFGIMEDTI